MNARAACLLILFATAGCPSILPKAPPQAYYDLKYDAQMVRCPRSYGSAVEVWDFAAAAPFDRAEMVVTDGREVSFSRAHQWVDRPGVLLAANLIRDLGGGRLFPVAVSPRDPEGAPLELTGTIYRFSWDKGGGKARARLQADVILRRRGDDTQIVLHRRYEVNSEPVAASDDASLFAAEMSAAAGSFSSLLRRDLCDALANRAIPTARR